MFLYIYICLLDLVKVLCGVSISLQAISVAERVADERCEPSPGSNGSLVGYQVRLDKARCLYPDLISYNNLLILIAFPPC